MKFTIVFLALLVLSTSFVQATPTFPEIINNATFTTNLPQPRASWYGKYLDYFLGPKVNDYFRMRVKLPVTPTGNTSVYWQSLVTNPATNNTLVDQGPFKFDEKGGFVVDAQITELGAQNWTVWASNTNWTVGPVDEPVEVPVGDYVLDFKATCGFLSQVECNTTLCVCAPRLTHRQFGVIVGCAGGVFLFLFIGLVICCCRCCRRQRRGHFYSRI